MIIKQIAEIYYWEHRGKSCTIARVVYTDGSYTSGALTERDPKIGNLVKVRHCKKHKPCLCKYVTYTFSYDQVITRL